MSSGPTDITTAPAPSAFARAGTVLVLVGLGMWLESYAAALFAIVPTALVMGRLKLEERFLQRELPGYGEYAARVPHRLLPGIW